MTGPFTPDELRDGVGFLGYPSEGTRAAGARVAIIPVPYDRTSTWHKGADRGPAAILDASPALEEYDIELDRLPIQCGIAVLRDVECELPPEAMCDRVHERVGRVLDAGLMPIVLGGEHSVTIGAVRAASEHVDSLSVLQIDAHADLRESYHGSACNHACVMARAREVASITQVGIRAIDAAERPSIDESRVFWAHEIVDSADESWIDRVCEQLSGTVYITIDLDGFDPSVVPATGTPEPGGLRWGQVNRLLTAVASRRRIIGADVVELCPREGLHASEFLAAKLVYRLIALGCNDG